MNISPITIAGMISTDAYIAVNKSLIRALKLPVAAVLCELCSIYKLNYSRNNIVDGEWFPVTVDYLQNQTGLLKDEQQAILDKLVSYNLIKYAKKGVPARRHVCINWDLLLEVLNTGEPLYIQSRESTATSGGNTPQQVEGNSRDLSEESTATSSGDLPPQVEGNSRVIISNNNINIQQHDDVASGDTILMFLSKINMLLTSYNLQPISYSQAADNCVHQLIQLSDEELDVLCDKLGDLAKEDSHHKITLDNPTGYIVKHPDMIPTIIDGKFVRKKKAAEKKRSSIEVYDPTG